MSIIPNFLYLLPDGQSDNEVNDAKIAALTNFDFRDKKTKKLCDFEEVKPSTLTVYGTEFTDLYKLGTFIYAVKDPVAGLSHFGENLFVMMGPNRFFEKRNAQQSPRERGKTEDTNQLALNEARRLLAVGGLDYMKACFEYAQDLAKGLPIVVVLGEQHKARDVNLEPYDCEGFISCCDRQNNVHQYTTIQTAVKKGIPKDIEIFHVNMKYFEDANIDSIDIEKLFNIYEMSLAQKRPLIIHCTDGMDRSGGLALAYQLLHNWGRVFTSPSATEIVDNIKREHEAMQQRRGPSFCTATKKRIEGAVLLAGIMKAIQKSKELINRAPQLADKVHENDYLQQIYFLEERQAPENTELLKILKSRLALEKIYFEKFAWGIQHSQVDLFIIETILIEELKDEKADEKESLYQRFLLLKMTYINNGFDDDSRKALASLKSDTESYQTTHKIKLALSNSSSKEDINQKLSAIEVSKEDKALKLKRKKVLLLEVQVIKLYQEIEKILEDNPDSKNFSISSEYKTLKTTLDRAFNEARILEPTLGKIENLIASLDHLRNNIYSSIAQERNSLSESNKKIRTGSLRLSTSPRGSRRFVVTGDEAPPSIESPAESARPSSPRRGSFLGFSNSAGSKRGSRVLASSQSDDSKETKQTPSEYSTEDPTSTGLASSLSQFFKAKLSPRNSVLVPKPLTTSMDADLSSSGVQEPDQTPPSLKDSEEFKKALEDLANAQGLSERVQRPTETSPRASRTPPKPLTDSRRRSFAADEELPPNQSTQDDDLESALLEMAKITKTF